MTFRPEHLTLSPSPPGGGPEHHTDPTNRPPLETVMSSKRKCCVSGQCDSVSLGASSLTAPGRLHFLSTHGASTMQQHPTPQSLVSLLPTVSEWKTQVAESWFHGLALSTCVLSVHQQPLRVCFLCQHVCGFCPH